MRKKVSQKNVPKHLNLAGLLQQLMFNFLFIYWCLFLWLTVWYGHTVYPVTLSSQFSMHSLSFQPFSRGARRRVYGGRLDPSWEGLPRVDEVDSGGVGSTVYVLIGVQRDLLVVGKVEHRHGHPKGVETQHGDVEQMSSWTGRKHFKQSKMAMIFDFWLF